MLACRPALLRHAQLPRLPTWSRSQRSTGRPWQPQRGVRVSTAAEAEDANHSSQLINSAGLQLFWQGRPELALPHLDVPSIAALRWDRLAAHGYRGVVFDKDNTLTLPYDLSVHDSVASSLRECLQCFGDNVVIFSNSAGLEAFDEDFAEARKVEAALGVAVLRHAAKKPAGGVAEVTARFACAPGEIMVVGDRYLTDVAFANLNGALAVRVAPFDTRMESSAVKASRRTEELLVARSRRKGVQPPAQTLVGEGGVEALAEGIVRARIVTAAEATGGW